MQNGRKKEADTVLLFRNLQKSGILLAMIKKILGDTTADLSEAQTEESDVIQKMILYMYLIMKN